MKTLKKMFQFKRLFEISNPDMFPRTDRGNWKQQDVVSTEMCMQR